jgi:hypothetical protein
MSENEPENWNHSTDLAGAILHDRAERRKWLARMLVVPVAMLALGLWVLDDWIWQSPWRALAWWGACAAATLIMVIFALYDALAVIREERAKHNKR